MDGSLVILTNYTSVVDLECFMLFTRINQLVALPICLYKTFPDDTIRKMDHQIVISGWQR